jgi:hypothetical protein
MMSLSRPTARKITTKLSCAAGISLGLLGFSAAPGLAASTNSAVCEGQTFSQPFAALKDTNSYTLVPGSEFNQPSAGWELSKGAQVVQTVRPDGSTAQALDMPSGAVAVSPPVCVTLRYPTARAWVRNVKGGEGISVAVAYANSKTETAPKNVGQVHGNDTAWTLSNPINVQPQTAGPNEETRQVRFVFLSGGKTSDFELFGFYVDPRMR